jgi:hypothetical protein
MGDRYYIPILPFVQDSLDSTSKALIVPNENNIVEFNSETDFNNFLDSLNNVEYIDDKKIYDIMQELVPDISDYIKDVPMPLEDLKGAFGNLIEGIPDERFAGKPLAYCLKIMFDSIIRKNENTFIVLNIRNGSLKCNEDYKYHKTESLYFDMMKLEYNLDTYYSFFCDVQSALRTIFLKNILFSDDPIDDVKKNLINRAFNINGQALADFRQALEGAKSKINNHRWTIKKINMPLLPRYNEIEKATLSKISDTLVDVDKNIKETYESKKQLAEEIKKRHNLISIETAKNLLREIKWLRPFIKED